MEIYGYIIEKRYELTHIKYIEAGMLWSEWYDYNHKVYRSKEIANDAIEQMKKCGLYGKHQFRIIPLFIITEDEKER